VLLPRSEATTRQPSDRPAATSAPASAADPGLDYRFAGTAKVATTSGYTFDFKFELAVAGPMRTSIENDKPGEATLHAGQIRLTASFANTTPGRNASIYSLTSYGFWGLFPEGHAVCGRKDEATYELTRPQGRYCSLVIASAECGNGSLELPASTTLSCQLMPVAGRNNPAELSFPAWPERDLSTLRADLMTKQPLIAVVDGSRELDGSRYPCLLGMTYVLVSSPDEIMC
jgi:hypothetical protein